MIRTDMSLADWTDEELLAALDVGAGRREIVIELRRRTELAVSGVTSYLTQLLDRLPPASEEVREAIAALSTQIEIAAQFDTFLDRSLPAGDYAGRLRDLKPLPDGAWARMALEGSTICTRFTWSSIALEGNTLTLHETQRILQDGVTIPGKSMREHLEAINHSVAVGLMYDMAYRADPLDVHVMLSFHRLLMHGIDDVWAGAYETTMSRFPARRIGRRTPALHRTASIKPSRHTPPPSRIARAPCR